MLIQLSTPRPLINLTEHSQHVVIFTLRKIGTSKGEIKLNMNINVESGQRETVQVEPYEVFPIDGEPHFEALQYYLPFDQIYGTHKTTYSEEAAMASWNQGPRKEPPRQKTPDTILALLSASGINVIAHSAYRSESKAYEERIFNAQFLFPVTGGGVVRVTGSAFDIANPTFEPKAVIPSFTHADLERKDAFNRIHRLMPSSVEARRQARIAGGFKSEDVKKLPP